jgi:hypothetical protein
MRQIKEEGLLIDSGEWCKVFYFVIVLAIIVLIMVGVLKFVYNAAPWIIQLAAGIAAVLLVIATIMFLADHYETRPPAQTASTTTVAGNGHLVGDLIDIQPVGTTQIDVFLVNPNQYKRLLATEKVLYIGRKTDIEYVKATGEIVNSKDLGKASLDKSKDP